MSKHFLGCKPQLLGVWQAAYLANTPGLKRRGWGEEKTISCHLSITSFSAYNNLFYRRGSWDWEKLLGPYGKLMPRSSGLQSCALTCHSSWEERKHMSLCCISSTVLLAPPPGVGQYLGQFPCSLGTSLIKACKSFNNEFKARDHVILFPGTYSELGWVHYDLSLAQCLRSIGSPQDNLGAGYCYHCLACLPPLRLSGDQSSLVPVLHLMRSEYLSGEHQGVEHCSRKPPAPSDYSDVGSYCGE